MNYFYVKFYWQIKCGEFYLKIQKKIVQNKKRTACQGCQLLVNFKKTKHEPTDRQTG